MYAVTPAYELDLPQAGPRHGCVDPGVMLVGWHGAEDPRLFWTDAGTPALLFGKFGDRDPRICRGIGLVQDLRTIFPQLNEAMSGPSASLTRESGQPSSLDLLRDHGMGVM